MSTNKNTLSEIKPIWAVTEKDFCYLSESYCYEDICFLKISMESFLDNSDFSYTGKYDFELVNKSTRYDESKKRYEDILNKWKNNIPINPPQCNYDGKFYIKEGNHRTALCVHLDASEIVVSVHKDVVDSIKEIQFEVLDTLIDD
ncbi:MAG: hypothetical protein QM653_05160 [Dysgonomonas sp.]|uniref:hypothetical protein n=1 Tax=Dysgonomonas sp. TaxID=1891233 RepID=UPI0039E428BC